MSEDGIKLTDDATINFFGSLVMNFVSAGEAEAELVEKKELTKEQQITVMQANTLFTVAAMYFMTVLQDKDLETMRKILTIWSLPMVQDLVNIAFADEIQNVKDSMQEAIDSMEKEANKDASTE